VTRPERDRFTDIPDVPRISPREEVATGAGGGSPGPGSSGAGRKIDQRVKHQAEGGGVVRSAVMVDGRYLSRTKTESCHNGSPEAKSRITPTASR